MSFDFVLGVVGAVQGVFLVLLVTFLSVRRSYERRRHAAFSASRGAVAEPLRAWLVAGHHPEPVVRAIRSMPRGTAIGYVSLLARQTIPEAQREEFAEALRGEPWILQAISQSRSRYWWRRLESARALALIGGPRDSAVVEKLLADSHPAVQIAAISCLPHVGGAGLIGSVLDRHSTLPKVVRQYLTHGLRRSGAAVGPALAQRIRDGVRMEDLASWIELAEALDDPGAIRAALERVAHPAEGVRRTVARALRRLPGPDSQRALELFFLDPVPSVRAAAARTAGELSAATIVPALEPLLRDRVWVVRLRAAMSLAHLGERGRSALRAAREGADPYAADMARMVSGLSEGALFELGDA